MSTPHGCMLSFLAMLAPKIILNASSSPFPPLEWLSRESTTMSSSPTTNANVAARRLLKSFLDDVNEFARSGTSFRDCSESERRALNNLMTQRYLVEGIYELPSTPIVNKAKEIISDFINNKCRALEYCVTEKVKEENANFTSIWTCNVCGKLNSVAANEKRSVCVVCGRKRDYQGSKKTQQLNKLRIDPTPLSTVASKERLIEARQSKTRASTTLNFLATKADYEEIQRCCMKDEINDVLQSVRSIMGDIVD